MIFTPDERKALLALCGLLLLGLASRLVMPEGPPPAAGGDSLLVRLARLRPAVSATPPPPGLLEEGAIRINEASEADLVRLPGIGPKMARRIIETRSRIGAFRSAADLRKVRGVGPKTAERLVPLISFASGGEGDSTGSIAECTRIPHGATIINDSIGFRFDATPGPSIDSSGDRLSGAWHASGTRTDGGLESPVRKPLPSRR